MNRLKNPGSINEAVYAAQWISYLHCVALYWIWWNWVALVRSLHSCAQQTWWIGYNAQSWNLLCIGNRS